MTQVEHQLRYKELEHGFRRKTIRRMREITDIIPVTVLLADMGLNYNTITRRLLDPGTFTMNNVKKLAALAGVEPSLIFDIIVEEIDRK